MTGYNLVNLNHMLEEIEEDRIKSMLLDFSCPLNKDVEEFLHHKAIEFSKQSLARVHLVYASYKCKPVIAGYFTLSSKVIVVSRKALSNNMKKKVAKFGTFSPERKAYVISAPLIGQLGKNYTNGYNQLITGDELLKIACDKVKYIQGELGGKILYLECEDVPQLIEFYTSNGFVEFGKRELDGEETEVLKGEYLVQLLKYLK